MQTLPLPTFVPLGFFGSWLGCGQGRFWGVKLLVKGVGGDPASRSLGTQPLCVIKVITCFPSLLNNLFKALVLIHQMLQDMMRWSLMKNLSQRSLSTTEQNLLSAIRWWSCSWLNSSFFFYINLKKNYFWPVCHHFDQPFLKKLDIMYFNNFLDVFHHQSINQVYCHMWGMFAQLPEPEAHV